MNYFVVLFKNKEKKKIINKFKTLSKANKFYQNLLSESNSVQFQKQTENGISCYYELALMEKKDINNLPIYIKDELGRTIKVETDDENLKISKISKYYIEEEFVDYKTKNKITLNELEKKYLKMTGIKLLSKLNNKVVLQVDDYSNLFTFKSEEDTDRFLDVLIRKYQIEKRIDCLIVKDTSSPQKKYLYNLLVNLGYPKSYLQRYSTTFLSKK